MSRRPKTAARTLATSVLPTPTSPSSSTGLRSESDTSRVVDSPRSAREPPCRRLSVSSVTFLGYSTGRVSAGGVLAVSQDQVAQGADGTELAFALEPGPPR